MEVIAVVEGIDPLTSGTFQALQSCQKEDVIFGGSFAKCFTDDNVVDFDLFHCVVDTADDNNTCRDDASHSSYHSNIVDAFNKKDALIAQSKDEKEECVLKRSERTTISKKHFTC